MRLNYATVSVGPAKGKSVSIEEAKKMVLSGYNVHNFICGRKNEGKNSIGVCQVPITLSAVRSNLRDAYFRQGSLNIKHTCSIKTVENVQANTKYKSTATEYRNGEAVFDFCINKQDGMTIDKKGTSTKSDDISIKSRKLKSSDSNKVIKRRKRIKTLESVVANRYTCQEMVQGGSIYLDDLFCKIEDCKSGKTVKYPHLPTVWFGNAYLTVLKAKNSLGKPVYQLKFPHQTIEKRAISIFLDEIDIVTLLPNYQELITTFDGENTNKHLLHVYTTEKTTTNKSGEYENVLIDPSWTSLKDHIIIKP